MIRAQLWVQLRAQLGAHTQTHKCLLSNACCFMPRAARENCGFFAKIANNFDAIFPKIARVFLVTSHAPLRALRPRDAILL